MIEKKIQSKLSECVKYTYIPTTHNLDEICVLLQKEGKTYAEWQKERYKRFYDVKTGIENDIELMHIQCYERQKKKIFNDIVKIFKKEVR